MLPDPAPIIRTLIIVLINWVVRHQRCYKSLSTLCNIYHPYPHDVCKSPGPLIIIEIMRTCSSPFRHAAQEVLCVVGTLSPSFACILPPHAHHKCWNTHMPVSAKTPSNLNFLTIVFFLSTIFTLFSTAPQPSTLNPQPKCPEPKTSNIMP